jgi:hypothetical protein
MANANQLGGQKAGDARVVFTSGYVLGRNLVAISSYIEAVEEQNHELTRMFSYQNGEWGALDLNGITVLSVCGSERPSRTLYCLGRDGTVYARRSGKPSQERIPEAGAERGQLGYVRHICEIAGVIYVCGVSGQIYRREPTGWAHFDEGVLDRKSRGRSGNLYCMDGTSAKDIYAVGQAGHIWHYDGGKWEQVLSPTNFDLNWVTCVSPTEVYLCGNRGFFFRGSRERWEDISLPDKTEDLWSVEVYQGKVYVAGDKGLYVFDGKRVEFLDTGMVLDGHRLHANDGVLWSFGNEHLAYLDGKKWNYVKHPDNP